MTAAVLDSLAPAEVTAGSGAVTVTVTGSGLTADGALLWNGAADPAYTFIGDTSISFDLTAITTDVEAANTVGFRNALAEDSNELTFTVAAEEVVEVPPGQETGGVQPKPEDSLSPNTPAQAAVYHAPEPPDVYQQAIPVQVPPDGRSTVTGVPRPHVPEPEELPTTNAYKNGDGGLPNNPREPYPTGHPRADTWARLQGAR